MVSKHCVFYLFVVLFVALGVHACIINEESTVIAQETHDILNLIYKSVFSTHAQMKKMQYYLWEGAAVYSSLYRVKNVTSKLIKTLDKVVQYKAFNGTEASPIPACTDNYNKICQEISSIRTIEGELESVMQSLIYKKLRDSTNNVTANQLDIFERIFYAQRLASRLATIST